MFEAYAGNKYKSSGIIYWMYNSAWPSLYWQLYDYFLAPNGAFYGARKACEQLHIQYAYGDKAIYIVNGNYEDYEHLKVTASVYNMDMTGQSMEAEDVAVGADESKKIMDLDWAEGLSDVYFLRLELKDQADQLLSGNFYWLSARGDEEADFTALNDLPPIDLDVTVSPVLKEGNKWNLDVELTNNSSSLGFSINPKVVRSASRELVLPVYWDDNYFALLPGQTQTVHVYFYEEGLDGEKPVLELEGWNINPIELIIE